MSPDRNPSTPVKIEQVAPLNTDPNESFVAQGSVQLSPSQLAKVDKFDSKGLAALLPAGSAVPTDSGFIGATLMGAATKTVTITGMHILKQCQPPLTGTDFYNPPAGLDPTISLGFDLDSPITYAQVSQGGEYSGNFFQQNTISLAPGETRTLAVYVTTHQHYCRFSFQMTVATTYGTVTENIDNGGKQFQLTAQAEKADQSGADFSHYQAVYVGGVVVHPGEGWTRVNPKTYDETEDPASFPPPTPTGNQP
ncbi:MULTISPECIES: hypothetical protein [unclassified Kitasatospora]|uniref:hypothetical protein n=1 Tax=unclassified Kitasatospora TaxID=2633591 RepID=UPI0024748824|nr:hypothetical protein [Kitasatospora sp. MAP12-44]